MGRPAGVDSNSRRPRVRSRRTATRGRRRGGATKGAKGSRSR